MQDFGGTILDEAGKTRLVRRAFANPSDSGANEIIEEIAGERIRVLAVHIHADDAVDAEFQTATTAISPLYPLAANGGFVLPYCQHGWFETAAGEPLNLDLSSAVAVAVTVVWVPAR